MQHAVRQSEEVLEAFFVHGRQAMHTSVVWWKTDLPYVSTLDHQPWRRLSLPECVSPDANIQCDLRQWLQCNSSSRNWFKGSIGTKTRPRLLPWASVPSNLPSEVTLDSAIQGSSAGSAKGLIVEEEAKVKKDYKRSLKNWGSHTKTRNWSSATCGGQRIWRRGSTRTMDARYWTWGHLSGIFTQRLMPIVVRRPIVQFVQFCFCGVTL